MADSITSSNILGITINNSANNPDAKNQTIKLVNPRTNVTETEIRTVMANALNDSLFVDKYDDEGEPIFYDSNSSIVTAYRETQEIEKLDIGIE